MEEIIPPNLDLNLNGEIKDLIKELFKYTTQFHTTVASQSFYNKANNEIERSILDNYLNLKELVASLLKE